ncbi:SAM-dependent methyltransferase TehB [Bergeriella denitrificans]|uniref:Tellurite resistance protein TehB n=1 Tax=Bergeriella denitrificans TaxID=494 RepID=A0A378UE80_BERDE|nr:SAM-dependent methyltransferase TehB [Bergeriella denitrificans]STZ75615.1 tellurite resistance protein TehB [Bergeriella denitrificans]
MSEQQNLQQALLCYGESPVFSGAEIPENIWAAYPPEEHVWVGVSVEQGALDWMESDSDAEIRTALSAGSERMVAPNQPHRLAPQSSDTAIKLAFYCDAADYFHKKYGMSATHSAVRAAQHIVPAGKALDMGCGQGRNALFLGLKGFNVTAVDANPQAVRNVAALAQQEGLPVRAFEYDLNTAALQEDFDYIVATVVLMFLQPQRIPAVIADMQAHTRAGGYNLIVSAMDTADYPCPMPFPFKFQAGELRHYYQDWEIVEYREELGAMHARDEAGNPIRFKFVTMLAKKPE